MLWLHSSDPMIDDIEIPRDRIDGNLVILTSHGNILSMRQVSAKERLGQIPVFVVDIIQRLRKTHRIYKVSLKIMKRDSRSIKMVSIH